MRRNFPLSRTQSIALTEALYYELIFWRRHTVMSMRCRPRGPGSTEILSELTIFYLGVGTQHGQVLYKDIPAAIVVGLSDSQKNLVSAAEGG